VTHVQGPEARLVAPLTVAAKVALVLLVWRVVLDPSWANLDGKAPVARVFMYPAWAFVVPAWWFLARRTTAFPWLADLLVTLTCLTDLVGNRLDLYDSVVWFDDWMHVLNSALVSSAFVLLAVPRNATLATITTTAVSFGLTASLAWELFEYVTFLTRSTEWTSAYSDTIGDLSLGWVGSVAAALLIAAAWRHTAIAGRGSGVRPGHLPRAAAP
jgi:hypothetical protein